MSIPSAQDLPLWANGLAFALSALAVWIAGTQLARYANVIAVKSGLGHVTVGMVLLGGITSLPEGAVSVFSALSGAPSLAVNNLLGGVAMQKTLLAVVDGFIGREALTVVSASPVLLLQAVLTLLLLTVAAAVIGAGDVAVLGIGLGAWALLALYLLAVWQISNTQGRQPWVPRERAALQRDVAATAAAREKEQADPLHAATLKALLLRTAGAALVVLVAGFVLSQTGEGIAAQTGLGLSFVGAVLLAFATSLPELSTVVSAMRLRQYEMATSDILGTNLFNVALIFLVDLVYAGEPVLAQAGMFAMLMALLGVLLTAIFLIGLIERRDRTVGRMGIDSLATIVVYLGGLFVLYQLR